MSIPHVQYLDKASWSTWPDAEMQGYEGPGWYFWDETGAFCHGPYVAEIIAAKALGKYAKQLAKELYSEETT